LALLCSFALRWGEMGVVGGASAAINQIDEFVAS
jgi:hypothetical protein